MTRLFRSRVPAAAAGCLALALASTACDVNLGNGDFSLGLASGQSTTPGPEATPSRPAAGSRS